ncbi:DUF4114 domain-containing protein [Spirulina major]|uniref:DUF4114 domain-containing protein n=1 Tax=Spirulina major TaxID=270636 RepID=UPI00093564DD|nr:DUF4114 domain-containing protein [Spirulina major]
MVQKFIVENESNVTAVEGFDLKVPTFVDWDGDGDFDLVIGHNKASDAPANASDVNDSALLYFTNDGTGVFTRQTGSANPFNSLEIKDTGNPALGNAFTGGPIQGAIVDFFDADGDGDLDMLVGGSYGNLYFYENDPAANSTTQPFGTALPTGENSNVTATDNKLLGEIVGTTAYAAPRFVDIDGDKIPEHLFIGHYNAIDYYINDSNTSEVNFVKQTGTANPFNGIDLTDSERDNNRVVPYFADFSGDDIFDAFVGSEDGSIRYFLNTGTNTTPVFEEQFDENNPFNDLIIGTGDQKRIAPAFADIDGDEAIEAYVGTDGTSDPIFAFENFTETGTNPTDFLFYDDISQRFVFGPSGVSGSNLKMDIEGAPSSRISNIKLILKDKVGTPLANGTLDAFFLLPGGFLPNNFAAPSPVIIDEVTRALGGSDVTGVNFEFGVQLSGSSSLTLFDQITSSSTGVWQLRSSSAELSGLTITLRQTTEIDPTSSNGVVWLWNDPGVNGGVEVIDLTGASGLTATFSLFREAVFNNVFGLYRVDDPLTGAINGLTPGSAGYARAAIENRVAGLDLTVNNNSTSGGSATGFGGAYYAPFILAGATIDEFLADNPNNEIDRKNQAYFAYNAANPDGQDHLIMLGNNIFGFEDLSGGGDFDYNDMVVQIDFA